ncbi:hypothetical protein ALP10_04411 [Pseudomonas syringae pv. helianthi]|uniref:Uncharacterized protein n=2 Tax=Pseudomonas syringae group genomosp. 7 TaxID=251699 RepID=A0A3M6CSE3_9PSED|nr:hypothetical protein ALP10_04411 [Pseudomonas syringae pv. helianthi]RMW12488.1 hypothetical protein ALO98_03234 [Pseudomonas syringae pv. tagetis]
MDQGRWCAIVWLLSLFREKVMRDLNPLYSAVLQAVEAMSPIAEDARQPDSVTHSGQDVPAPHCTSRLHQWVNGNFEAPDEPAVSEVSDEAAASSPADEPQ